MKRVRCYLAASLLSTLFSFYPAMANADSSPLETLLNKIQQESTKEQSSARQEVARFSRQVSSQKKKLKQTRDELEQLNQANTRLEDRITRLQARLKQQRQLWKDERKSLNTLFETVAEHNRIFSERVTTSGLWKSDSTGFNPSDSQQINLKQIQLFWHALLEQTVLSGRIMSQQAEVKQPDGTPIHTEVTQFGPFTSLSKEGWLRYLPEQKTWLILDPQPNLTINTSNMVIDPSLGPLLEKAATAPGWFARFKPAGIVGILIALAGLAGFGIALVRLQDLWREKKQVQSQINSPTRDDNCLGRVMAAARDSDRHSIEAVIDEAVLKEVPTLRKGLGTLAVLAGIPPLLGLLGTVGGMIETFRLITEHGSTNSQLLSGGIAEALLTTELGLITAIPLLLLHCALRVKSTHLIEILEQQAAGLIVLRQKQAEPENYSLSVVKTK